MREYLEKQYQELAGKEAIKLAIKALTETVEAGSKNMEVLPLLLFLHMTASRVQHKEEYHIRVTAVSNTDACHCTLCTLQLLLVRHVPLSLTEACQQKHNG